MDSVVDPLGDPRAEIYIVDHLRPGAEITRSVRISNMSANVQLAKVYVGAASVSQDKFLFADAGQTNDLTQWSSVDHPSVNLAGWVKEKAQITIRVPKDATPGERYGVIWAETSSPDSSGNILQVSRVGVRIYLNIGPGGEPPSDFSIGEMRPGRTSSNVPYVEAEVRNIGARALDLSGKLSLRDEKNDVSAGPYALPLGSTLAPGASTTIKIELPKKLELGPWSARLTVIGGRVERTSEAVTLTFPVSKALGGTPLFIILVGSAGVVAVGAAVAIGVVSLRNRRRNLLS